MVKIENTISFAYPNGSARPTMGELANFVKTLDADPGDMDTMYRIAEEKAVFIRFKSEASMHYALMHNPEKLTFHYADGKAVEVRMSLAEGNVQYVRVFDLPPEVPDDNLTLVLEKYGKVKRVIREKFPAELGLDMYTGVRGVYIDVKQEIPSSLNFLNRKGNIFYSGNKDKCFLCKAVGHQMNSCPKRKARKRQENKEQSNNKTYAGVVSLSIESVSSDNNAKEAVDEVEVLEEEVLEEEDLQMDMRSSDSTVNNGEQGSETQKKQAPVFKCKNDEYYYYEFGIVDWTEKQRMKDEELAKQWEMEQEKRLEETKELRRRHTAEAKLTSPPRKSKKSS